MGGLDQLGIWHDPALAEGLAWYREVATNRRPAKFRIAATIPTALDPEHASEDALWSELERLTPGFLSRYVEIRDGGALPKTQPGPNLLTLISALARRMLSHCNFCAWNCGVDRSRGDKPGACKLASGARVSTYFHHTGEELFYRGTEGSGTIFFTSCNMRCAFCQNGDISIDKDRGEEVDARALAAMAWLLRREGCHNVNWVGGEVTIHLHAILEAIALLGAGFAPTAAKRRRVLRLKADRFPWFAELPEAASYDGGFNAPMLWNSNFFMTDEAMRLLRLVIDVWLPDFKFGPGRCAIELARTPRYWQTVTCNIARLVEWEEDFTVRHLVMPGHVDCCTGPVLEWLAAHAPQAPVNVMAQYHPDNFCDPAGKRYLERYAAMARLPGRDELAAAWRRASELGLRFDAASFEQRRGSI
jgi:putative pyruvate formate lyase activating enzyme